MTTVVLVHGAGDTAAVWRPVVEQLHVASLAVDLPGRGTRSYDLDAVTFDLAVDQVVRDVETEVTGRILLVAHSIAGALSPAIVRRLGEQVGHVVHVAALSGTPEVLPLAVAAPSFAENLLRDEAEVRAAVRGASYVHEGGAAPAGLRATSDRMALTRIDSLHFGCVPSTWSGVSGDVRRTFVQPLHDRLYPADAQARLAAAMAADEVVTIEAGHNVARSGASTLASILDDLARR